MTINQAGLIPAGTPGQSRTDGMDTGALVTLTSTGQGSTHEFELDWVPVGDTTAVPSLAPISATAWTYTPTLNKYGTYRIRLVVDRLLPTRVEEVRLFAVRTSLKALRIPALNEFADPGANLVSTVPPIDLARYTKSSEDNAVDYPDAQLNAYPYAGWYRALLELFEIVEVLAPAGGGITSVVNVGGGVGTFRNLTGLGLIANFRTLVAEGNMSIAQLADTITVSDLNAGSNTLPVAVDNTAASAGAGTKWSKHDHKHPVNVASAISITDSTNGTGVATTLALSDHTHGHGNRGGGSLHALVIPAGAAGFMSGADKTKLDSINPAGFITGGVNQGGGVEVFKDIAVTTMRFRTLVGVGAVSVMHVGDTVEIGGAGIGDFSGPAGATDEAIVVFNGVTGKLGKNTLATISAAGLIYTPSSIIAGAFSTTTGSVFALGASFSHALGDQTQVMNLENTGANPGSSLVRIGNRDPEGAVNGDSSDLYIKDTGATSTLYIKRSAAFNNTGWTEFGTTVLTATAPVNVTKAAAAVGVGTTAARHDHKHDITTAAVIDITDSTNAEGTATSLARSDHTHGHGNRGGGSLHAVVVAAGAAGFMSGADKTKLDGIATGAELNTAANVGGGAAVWRDKVGSVLNFRSVSGINGLVAVVSGDVINVGTVNGSRAWSDNDLTGAKTISFTAEYDNGNSGTAKTINWTNGQKQKVTLTGNCTFTFTAPVGPCSGLVLRLIQDGTGSLTVVWPAAPTTLWPNNRTLPTLSTAAASVDFAAFYYNGTSHFGNFVPKFA